MKTSTRFLSAIIAIPLMIGSSVALADGHGQKGPKAPNGIQAFFKDLDLTAEQQKQIKDIRKKMRQEQQTDKKAQQAERQADKQAIQALILSDTFDEAKAKALATKMANDQAENRVEKLRLQQQMFSILTPEQKTKFKASMEEMANKMQQLKSRMKPAQAN